MTDRLFNLGEPPRELKPYQYRRNISRVLAQAEAPEVNYGRTWYRDAHQYAGDIGAEFGVSLPASAGVIAVLSPGTEWSINKRDARQMLAETVAGKSPSFGYASYGQNVIKARNIVELDLRDEDYSGFIRGPKVTAFWNNILDPDNTSLVTVDFHAYSIAHNWRFTRTTVPKFSKTIYNRIALAYSEVAKASGYKPHELQAITWLTHKRINAL